MALRRRGHHCVLHSPLHGPLAQAPGDQRASGPDKSLTCWPPPARPAAARSVRFSSSFERPRDHQPIDRLDLAAAMINMAPKPIKARTCSGAGMPRFAAGATRVCAGLPVRLDVGSRLRDRELCERQ